MTKNLPTSRVEIDIDLTQKGRQIGDLKIKWSDNHTPIGYYLTPIICLVNGDGPTLLLTGGVHGDEFEGPAALMRVVHRLDVSEINGRIIILPALNAAAMEQMSRVSPLDGLNMNRAFPGNANGTPVEMIAHYVETHLLPQCDAVIDLHSGGKASIFASCVLANIDSQSPQGQRNLALAKAFAAPFLWVAGPDNDDRSLNAAAARQQLPMIAAELGGGGGCNPTMTNFTERAVNRCMHALGIIADDQQEVIEKMEYVRMRETFSAPATGLFDRHVGVGQKVEAGQLAGWLHFIHEPKRSSIALTFKSAGTVLAVTNRGIVQRGDLIAMIASPFHLEE